MLPERRQRTVSETDSYTSVQQRKRIRSNKRPDDKMSDKQCISLMPSCSDNDKVKQTKQQSPSARQWNGWKPLSNETNCNTTEKNNEFPPLAKADLYDPRFTPEPIKNWADYLDDEEAQENKKPKDFDKKHRFKRRLLLTENREKTSREQKPPKPILTDEHRLSQRQKQIDYGKNTMAYGRYVTEIPRHCRQLKDPRTPDKFQVCSTRSWDGQVKAWRRRLHEWDPPTEGKVDLFALTSQSHVLDNLTQKPDVNMEDSGSLTSSNSGEDFFKDLNIDVCLIKANLPL